ncbi:MAG: EAL domain-containing protein [Vallitaleaceae bacterium]|nr:EAL domain-containing protein [Vallitaleaceae bacterium]
MIQKRILFVLLMSLILSAITFTSIQIFLWTPRVNSEVLEVAKKDTGKVMNHLEENLEHLVTLTRDYALWDDSYAFLEDSNETYILNNLHEESLERLDLDFVMLRNNFGEVIYVSRKVYGRWSKVSLPESLILMQGDRNGFYQWDEEIYLMASSSVYPSNGLGEANGVILFGKVVEETFFQRIYESYGIQMMYRSVLEIDSKKNFLKKLEEVNEDYVIYQFDEEQLLNRYVLYDVLGKKIGYFDIYSSRSIAKIAYEILRSTILSLFIISLIVSLFLWKFLRAYLSKPISDLAFELENFGRIDLANVSEISGFPQNNNRVYRRRDEIGILINNYTNMKKHVIEKQKEIIRLNQNLDQLVQIRTKALEESNKNLILSDQVLSSTGEGVLIMDASFRVLRVNHAFLKMSKYSEEDIIDTIPSFIMDLRQNQEAKEGIWSELDKKDSWSGEIWDRDKEGVTYPQWLTINTIRDQQHNIAYYVCLVVNISLMKENERKLERLAYYDPLTQLPNRTLFQEHLQQAIYRASRKETFVAVIFVDLDRFKYINDSLGHDIGDKVLQYLSQVILKALRECDTVARFGGDEFTIILEEIKSTKQVIEISKRVLTHINQPIHHEDMQRTLNIGASMGIAMYPKDDTNIENLIRKADAAMYHAKDAGRNQYCFASTKIELQNQAYVELESSLFEAITRAEFELYLQPKMKQVNGEICISGAEALIRWIKADGIIITPDAFIPFAEQVGLIHKISEWVIQEICRIQVKLKEEGIRIPIGINISASTIAVKDFVTHFTETLQSYQLEPELFQIEITEEVLMKNLDTGRSKLQEIREMGMTISMDDFGTGFSSLSRLSELPLDELKIDKSFVWKIGRKNEIELVSSIISMAKAMNLKTVAEGVETEEQFHFLLKQGCNEFQGYLFSKPLSYLNFVRYYKETCSKLTHGGAESESILYRIYPSH